MKKMLKKIEQKLTGDASGLRGDVNGLRGNLDEREISEDERKQGIDIKNLVGD